MPKKPRKARVFSVAFKQVAVERLIVGENVSALSRALKVRRKLLYEWKDRFLQGGPEALRPPGRPPKPALTAPSAPVPAGTDPHVALAAAEKRLAELERKVGQQALELDFFVQALRHIEDRTAETGSTPPLTSKRRKAN
jgi:transposase